MEPRARTNKTIQKEEGMEPCATTNKTIQK
jgi:hypothetical protein